MTDVVADDGARQRLPFIPAIDGLRAIAVVAVLAYHHDPAAVPGGWLGVSLFFTLSGFLIGDLVLAEHAAEGRIALARFWERRVRRILPASLLAVALALGAAAVLGPDDRTAGDLRATLAQVANWRFVATDAPYAGTESTPSPVQHFWSLAIEEQFYLVLPLVAALALRRRLLGWAMLAVVGGSLAAQLTFDDLDRTYYGTDARVGELAAGVLLACALPAIRTALAGRRWPADAWGAVAMVGAGVAFATATLTADLLGAGALLAVCVVWAGLLIGATAGGAVSAVLGVRPLVALGAISYGVYLFHWPAYLVLTQPRTGLDGPALLAARVAATLVLAIASARLLELPIRRGALAMRRLVPALGVVAVGLLAATMLVQGDGADLTVIAAPTVSTTAPPSRATTTVQATVVDAAPGAPATTEVLDRAPAPTGGTRATVAPRPTVPITVAPTTIPARVPRLLVIGDSTAAATGRGLAQAAAEDGIAEVHVVSQPGCAVLRQSVARIREGYEYTSPCEDFVGRGIDQARQLGVDAVVVLVGSPQLADARHEGDADFRTILDPGIGDRYQAALGDAMGRLGQLGVPVLWADVPLPDWDLDRFGQMQGRPMPGTGEPTTNDPPRTERINRLDGGVASRFGHVQRWGYTAALAGPDGVIDPEVREDGLHLAPGPAVALSRSAILPALRDAFRAVIARGGAAAPASPTTWG